MLKIENVSLAVNGRDILHKINLTIQSGGTHVLFGPKGAGNNTPLMAVKGPPGYQVTRGSIEGMPPLLSEELERAVDASEKEVM